MAVFSPTNAKVHFKTYDGNFTDALGNTLITQNNGVSMSSAQKLFGQQSMYMANFSDSVTFSDASVFDVGAGDFSVGFWFFPTQFTSWDRLFCTDDYEHRNPFRLYNHNGVIYLYVESDTDETSNNDYVFGYDLNGLGGANNWYHIMVTRESGTSKLYINGVERASSTMQYTLQNASNPTLGADINAAVTGVKGYIQDFFWTDETVSFDQADFTPASAEAVAFHAGAPSNVSMTPSANSVAQAGDSVTFSFAANGATSLSLYNQTTHVAEDVLGLSSKSVTITEAVSYLLIAQNDEGQTSSAPVTITLSGGANMPFISDDSNNPGLVLQYKMLNESTELAQVVRVLNPKDGSDVSLNEAFEQALAARGLLSDALTAEIAAREADVTATQAARVAGDDANDAALVAATSEMDTALNTLSAARASKDSDQSAAVAAEVVTMNALVSSLATARAAADTSLNSSIDDAIALRVSMMTDASDARIAGDAAADLALSNEVSAEDTSLATEVSAREDGDDLLNANLTAEINARVADVAAKVQARQDGDSDAQASLASEVSAYEAARDAEVAARGAADSALSVKLANAEGDRISAISAEASARDAADVLRTSELAAAVSGREAAMVSAIAARVAGDANVQSLIDDENAARVADLAASSTERANKDVALTGELDDAINARISAVNAETALREADFVSISDDLAAEVTARGLALNTLASDRASGDGVQSAAMNTQAALRVSEMAAENTAMSDKDTLIASAITDEAVARAAGDANVSTKLKVLTDRLSFSGDSAGGGSLVLADPAAGVAPVTAKFEKVNATLVKLFLS